jgi:hypothetical protein
LAIVMAISCAVVGCAEVRAAGAPPGGATKVVTVQERGHGRVIPGGFLGLSFEYRAIEAYAGADPHAIDPVFEQLIRNISPRYPPEIRIGGDSTDWTWWQVPSISQPPGVNYTITDQWLQVTRAFTHALGARVILGINLEADSTALAVDESQALIDGVGRRSIQALELGNEPELYGAFGWYSTPDGRSIPGRPPGWDFPAFIRDYSSFAHVLPAAALAGPTTGGPRWLGHWPRFFVDEPRVHLATLHRYPLHACTEPVTGAGYPTIDHLMSDLASGELAAITVPYVAIAHADRLPLRVDEVNTISCGSVPAVGHSFAAALWVMGVLFQMAKVGVDGVNIHTYPGAPYDLFSFSRVNGQWSASVIPEYYGMLMFTEAAPPGSRLVTVSGVPKPIQASATDARDGTLRVLLINPGPSAQRLTLKIPARSAAGTLERLMAPSLASETGVTLGGRTYGSLTDTGLLAGPPSVENVRPRAATYRVNLPAGSAALLTIP